MKAKAKVKTKKRQSGTKVATAQVVARPKQKKGEPLFKPRIQMGIRVGTKGNGQQRRRESD